MQNFFLLIAFIGGVLQAYAQTDFARLKLEELKRASNVTIRDSDTDASGNLYVTGFFSGVDTIPTLPFPTILSTLPSGGTDIFVLKIDHLGNFEWAFQFGGGSDDRANAIKVDRANNRLIVAGQFSGNGVFVSVANTFSMNSTGTDTDAFLVIYDLGVTYDDGDFAIWAKVIGGVDFQTIYDLEVDDNGNIYVGGYYQSTCTLETSPSLISLPNPGSGFEGWVARYDFIAGYSFQHQWSARIGANNANDNVYDIAIEGGNCYVVGYATVGATISGSPTVFPGSSSGNAFLAKLSISGGAVTDFVNIASGASGSDAQKIKLRGNYAFIAGTFGGTTDFNPTAGTTDLASAGGRDVFVAKYDVSSAPNLLWAARIGGANNTIWDELGNIALQGDDVILACSHIGNATYSRKLGANLGSNFNMAGSNFDGTLLKISGDNGNLQWYHSISGANEDKLSSLALFNDNDDWYLWGVGSFQGNVDFNFEPNISEVIQGHSGSTFYAKYRFKLPQSIDMASFSTNTLPDGRIQLSAQTDANLPEVKFFSTNTKVAQVDNANILTIFPIFEEDEALIRAYHSGNTLFLPTDTVTLMKINSYSLVNHLQGGLENQLNIFPNPTSDYFILKNKNSSIIIENIEIFDTFGKKVASLLQQDERYNIKHLSKGIYYLYILTNEGGIRRKLIKN
jgi:hypothetical protein